MEKPTPKEISELEKRISLLAAKAEVRPLTVAWYALEDAKDESYAQKIHLAYEHCDDDERLELTQKLWQIYHSHMWGSTAKGDFRRIFGDDIRRGTQFMGTITGRGGALRIWSGFPAHIDRDHADSCGSKDLLLGVYGPPDKVKTAADYILPEGLYTRYQDEFHQRTVIIR